MLLLCLLGLEAECEADDEAPDHGVSAGVLVIACCVFVVMVCIPSVLHVRLLRCLFFVGSFDTWILLISDLVFPISLYLYMYMYITCSPI